MNNSIWPEPNKEKLTNRKTNTPEQKLLLESYISFCTKEINDFLIEAKIAIGSEKWIVSTPKNRQLLGPTTINGFFVCMRRIVSEGQPRGKINYKKRLEPLSSIDFLAYKSSAWKDLGDSIYEACFSQSIATAR